LLQPCLARLAAPDARNRAPNEKITLTVCLACCIHFFAGGDAYDIACMFGISHSSVFDNIVLVIEVVNNCDVLKIDFPSDHHAQRGIADRFLKKSYDDQIGCCVGCIDGILIWTHKPSKAECDEVGVSENKFFCGRQHKHGLNMQAICNHKKQLMDVSIVYGASASDHMSFEVSEIRLNTLSQLNFLVEGLCLFGDNSYVNTKFMATPYPNVGSDSEKDSYNFYHSQLRITVEGAFGLFTQRWGFLRKNDSSTLHAEKDYVCSGCNEPSAQLFD